MGTCGTMSRPRNHEFSLELVSEIAILDRSSYGD
jgi:hypothetical protein